VDADAWLALCKWAVVVGGLVATLGGAGVWYFDARVTRQRAPVARPLQVAPLAPVAETPLAQQTSEREVVRSLELRIAIEAADGPAGPGREGSEPLAADGAPNVVTLVMADRTQLRFVSDAGFSDQRLPPDRRRLAFTYRPESPVTILGQDVAVLGTVEVMTVDYRELFRRAGFARDDEPTTLTLTVVLNGVAAGTLRDHPGAPGLLSGTRAILDVSEAFGAVRAGARP
jgi:hypothetical protein